MYIITVRRITSGELFELTERILLYLAGHIIARDCVAVVGSGVRQYNNENSRGRQALVTRTGRVACSPESKKGET